MIKMDGTYHPPIPEDSASCNINIIGKKLFVYSDDPLEHKKIKQPRNRAEFYLGQAKDEDFKPGKIKYKDTINYIDINGSKKTIFTNLSGFQVFLIKLKLKRYIFQKESFKAAFYASMTVLLLTPIFEDFYEKIKEKLSIKKEQIVNIKNEETNTATNKNTPIRTYSPTQDKNVPANDSATRQKDLKCDTTINF